MRFGLGLAAIAVLAIAATSAFAQDDDDHGDLHSDIEFGLDADNKLFIHDDSWRDGNDRCHQSVRGRYEWCFSRLHRCPRILE